MNHELLREAINLVCPGAEWALSGDSYEGLTWLDKKIPKPSLEEIKAKMGLVECHKSRLAEYPSIGDQLDAIWKIILHGEFDQIPGDAKLVLDKILEVKTKYPKTI